MEDNLQELADRGVSYAIESGAVYCDVRAEIQNKQSASIENSEVEYINRKKYNGIGIRLLKNGAWGFCSIASPENFEQIKSKIEQALKNSEYSSQNKKNTIDVYKISASKIKKEFPVLKKPEIEKLIEIGLECDKIILSKPRIIQSTVNPWFSETSKYFTSSDGAQIFQKYTDVVIDMIATAHESGLTQSVNITEGGRGGIEQLIKNDKVQNSADKISNKSSELIMAKPIREEKATVVMNPDFVALLTHEIIGHPSEADRVLGKEM
ncbi:MAG: TldD/PmbA family protein, partial [Nitrosopumilus sp.]|nr:TldD/PmbA family protein [Nitrosopumilus sp.]